LKRYGVPLVHFDKEAEARLCLKIDLYIGTTPPLTYGTNKEQVMPHLQASNKMSISRRLPGFAYLKILVISPLPPSNFM
jgi:hypothetical protein